MASIKRHASAAWQGSGKDGNGSLTTQSATLKDTPYSFNARFGDGKGTNPEELIAAAHAGCFSMATAFQLSGAGHPPESLHTDARLEDRRGASDAARPRAGYRRREVPGTGGRGESELSSVESAERRDHAGRKTGVRPSDETKDSADGGIVMAGGGPPSTSSLITAGKDVGADPGPRPSPGLRRGMLRSGQALRRHDASRAVRGSSS
jgi:hypothetical protein